MRTTKSLILILAAWVWFAGTVCIQGQTAEDREAYIRNYAKLAVKEMHFSGIPASITLAQGLVESRSGVSELARTANNHFGIKCQMEWRGPRYYYDDDEKNECFRAYESVEESFRDHSLFLMYRSRYSTLFDLDPKDYKAWAHGLKSAGYATNPRYAYMLINIIEDHKLYQYDQWLPEIEPINSTREVVIPNQPIPFEKPQPKIYLRNRIDFVIADEDDSIESLTEEMGKLRWEIRKYNEIPRGGDIQPGQIVYLQPKRRQAEKGFTTHTVKAGETMYSISQHYGIKLRWLYKRNNMKRGNQPLPGDVLWLRGQKKE